MKRVTLLLIVVATIVVLLFIGRLYVTENDFSPSNPLWNGMASLAYSGHVRPLYTLDGLSYSGNEDKLLIVSPSVNYTDAESAMILSFMNDGGQVIVMDDYGTSNSLLDKVGSSISLVQVPLCQEEEYYKRPSFPLVTGILPSGVTDNVTSAVFNHPVSLDVKEGAEIIVYTSGLGWLDLNDNCLIDGIEKFGSYPVAAEMIYGSGKLVVIGDPDIMINSMLDKGDNAILASNILGGGTVYLDSSHGQEISPLARVLYVLRHDFLAQSLFILVVLATGYLYIQRYQIIRLFRKPVTEGPEKIDVKASIVDYMRLKLPLKEKDLREIKKKL
ncbi:DUF4350 domain-containing protein [Methanocella sp. CWC-04]|uniref:DUF4350 domain-containing protein n=1 Tax=Methanooceanicella nereidis TaxID=2052831 RepID=A0AAP2RC85_9EURY|nr:DUF4350 domain-containing protein [Methanocella sp. CWC-04]MCD1294886.1 DUF4350 domain-containing protein [Methanocella sp. CWC-04]